MDLDEAIAAAFRALDEPQRPRAELQAAPPSTARHSTARRPQPSLPYTLESAFSVTLPNTTSNASDHRTTAKGSRPQDLLHRETQTPGNHNPTRENITSHPATIASTNLPTQQTTAESAEATNVEISQPSEGAQLPSVTQNPTLDPATTNLPQQQTAIGSAGNKDIEMSQSLEEGQLPSFTQNPTLDPVSMHLPQQQTTFEGAGASYMQMSQSSEGAQLPSFNPASTNLPEQQTAFAGVGASYKQMPQSSEGVQLPSFIHNPIATPAARPIVDVQAMAGAQVKQVLPGGYHQGQDQSVPSADIMRQPPTSTNIRLPDPAPRVPQTNLYRPSTIPQGTGTTAQPLVPFQAPNPKGHDPTYRDVDPASIALQLHAYTDLILNKKGLLSLRARLEAQKQVAGNAMTLFYTQLPSEEHRNLALKDVKARVKSRINGDESPKTIRRAITLEIIIAECWIEWGKENNVDYSIHETLLQGLTKIIDLLGPEPEMPSLAPFPDADLQDAPQVTRPIPLNIEQLDLSQINVTEDPKECHWCRDEQPWGIPGGIHFKPYDTPDANADATDNDAAADYVSTMCRTCFAHRLAIGTHAQHGPFKDLPRTSADPYFAPGTKSSMRQTSCAVCTGLADGVCGGCPLRVCVNCQVVLDMQCAGNLDRLLKVYGKEGRRNDARLLGSGLVWGRGEGREVEMGEEEEEGEEEEDEDELIEGEFGRVWRELKRRDRGY